MLSCHLVQEVVQVLAVIVARIAQLHAADSAQGTALFTSLLPTNSWAGMR